MLIVHGLIEKTRFGVSVQALLKIFINLISADAPVDKIRLGEYME
jgi:hypothetical protein